MIQLASDPNASRMNWRPAPADDKASSLQARRGKAGHAWPFISRYGEKPAGDEQDKKQSTSEHGS